MNVNFRIYLITDRKKAEESRFIENIETAVKSGIKAIQLREKDLSARELTAYAYKIRDITKRYDASFLINDRVDVALAVGAEGVHLGHKSMPLKTVRTITDSEFLIGVSTHSLDEALDAQDEGADFITIGPIYETPSKMDYGRPLGSEALRGILGKIRIPVFAIGGINERNIPEVMKTGVNGVAMISAIFGSDNIEIKTRKIMRLMS